jgi:co-chaperonin GroES (HSP10)
MSIQIEGKDLNKFIMVGDRILIKPRSPLERTKTGLFLPPGVQQNEKIQSGYVVKVGPGYPIPAVVDDDEAWKKNEQVKYIPLQPKEGDLAVYLQNNTFEIQFNDEKYIVVSQAAILFLIRDENLFQ